MDSLLPWLLTATVAYVSTNIDGYALLLGFFSNARYRAGEIVAGQFVSMAVQMLLSFAIMQSGGVRAAPFVGLAGMVPLIVGIRRIARLRQCDGAGVLGAANPKRLADGALGRIAAVAVVATSGAIDNVLVYASVLMGRASGDVVGIASVFSVLTAVLCACAFLTARSRMSMSAIQVAAGRIAAFATTAIGMSLLLRFDTLAWIYSLA